MVAGLPTSGIVFKLLRGGSSPEHLFLTGG